MLQTRKWMRNSGKRWGLNREAGEKRDEEWEEEMDRDIISKSWEWVYKNKQMEVLVSSLWILIDFLSVWWTICCIIRKLIFHQQHSWKRNERDECHEWWQSTSTWKDCEYFTPHSFTLCTFVPFSWSMSSSSSSSKWFFQELLVTFPSPVSQVIESIYAWTSNKSIGDKMTHFLSNECVSEVYSNILTLFLLKQESDAGGAWSWTDLEIKCHDPLVCQCQASK